LIGLLRYLKDTAPQFLPKILIIFQQGIATSERCVNQYSEFLQEYPEISCMDIDLTKYLEFDDYLSKRTINEYTRLARRDGIIVSVDELINNIGAKRKGNHWKDREEEEIR